MTTPRERYLRAMREAVDAGVGIGAEREALTSPRFDFGSAPSEGVVTLTRPDGTTEVIGRMTDVRLAGLDPAGSAVLDFAELERRILALRARVREDASVSRAVTGRTPRGPEAQYQYDRALRYSYLYGERGDWARQVARRAAEPRVTVAGVAGVDCRCSSCVPPAACHVCGAPGAATAFAVDGRWVCVTCFAWLLAFEGWDEPARLERTLSSFDYAREEDGRVSARHPLAPSDAVLPALDARIEECERRGRLA